jgi:hypothetical protein
MYSCFYRLLFFILVLLHFSVAKAQLDNTFLSDKISLHDNDSNLYGIRIQAVSYLRNTEYFNNIEVGRTLFGYQLNPSFYIQPHKHILLQAGVYLRSDFGSKSVFTQAMPTFSLKLLNGKSYFIFGTLEGALAHALAEPLFDISSGIERHIENGFQFRSVREKLFADVWINWERFIERGSPFKEQFTAGFNIKPRLFHAKEKFSLSLPIQFIAHHKGGQIDTDTSKMIMVFNGGTGIEADYITGNHYLKRVTFNAMRLFYRENSNSGYFYVRNGNGKYANLLLQTKWLSLMFSYWNGHNFIAPRGTSIYQSVAIDKPGYTETERRLLFIRFMYEREIAQNFFLVIRYEPFIDLNNKLSDYSYSVYITYRDHFGLGRLSHL